MVCDNTWSPVSSVFSPVVLIMSLDADSVSPPDGQSSFSGIPGAQFLEDVDSYMKGEESADAKLKVGNEPERD